MFNITLQKRIFFFTMLLIVFSQLLLWLGIRPKYAELLLDERSKLVSQEQEYVISKADRSIQQWVYNTNVIARQIMERPEESGQIIERGIELTPRLSKIVIKDQQTDNTVEATRAASNDVTLSFTQDNWLDVQSDSILKAYFLNHNEQGLLLTFKKKIQIKDNIFELFTVYNASGITKDLLQFPINASHFVTVIDAAGRSIIGTIDSVLASSIQQVDGFSRVSQEKSISYNGNQWFVSSSPFQTLPLQFYVGISENAIFQPLSNLLIYSLYVSGFILLLMMGFTWYTSRKINEPISQLINDIEYMADLDFEHQIRKVTLPEFTIMQKTLEDIRLTLLRYQRINVEKIILEEWKNKFLMTYTDAMIALAGEDGSITFANKHLKEFARKDLNLKTENLSKGQLIEHNNVQVEKSYKVEENPSKFNIEVVNAKLKVHREGKSPLFFDLQSVTILNDKKESIGSLLLFLDLTKERMMDRKRNEMINIIVHQLLNPLTGIIGLAKLLKDTRNLPEEEKVEFLQDIISSGERINHLIDRFLSIKKLEAEDKPIVWEKVNLNEAVDSLLAEFKGQVISRDIDFEISVTNGPDVYVDGQRDLILDAVQNLITNALKYGPDDRTIEIELFNNSSQAGLSVTDHGYGIKPEEKNKIFNKFYRIKSTKDRPGTGLGLPYVKEIMNRHEGDVTISSSEEIGSCFTLIFKKHTKQ